VRVAQEQPRRPGQPIWWYNDTVGVNLSTPCNLVLSDIGGGIYRYENSSFFPIDGQLLGNEGRSHNYHFTLELHSQFTYQTGQKFQFTGDDDVFVFINNALVIDLGGVHGAESAAVNLDTLGLTAGQDYAFDLFFAERHTTESNFKMETSMVLGPTVPLPGAALLGLLGLSVAGWRLKRNSAEAAHLSWCPQVPRVPHTLPWWHAGVFHGSGAAVHPDAPEGVAAVGTLVVADGQVLAVVDRDLGRAALGAAGAELFDHIRPRRLGFGLFRRLRR
jgi:fibro-slime domain-containing protein